MKNLLKHKVVFSAASLALLLTCSNLEAQAGTIYWKDGNTSKIDSFTEISIELVYHWWNRHGFSYDSEGFYRKYNVPELKELTFIRQRGRWSTGFYYRVRICGVDDNGQRIEEEIPTWDWIDMTVPSDGLHKKTRVTFFHQKKRISLHKIAFE